MLGFNETGFIDKLRSTVQLRGPIEQVAQRIHDSGAKNLYLIGAGGTYAAALPYEHLLRSRSTLPVRAVIGTEFLLAPDAEFGADSVAVFASVSGTTEDVLEAIAFAKSRGALTVGFTGYPDSPFAEAVDVVLLSAPKAWPFDVQLLLLSTRLLALRGEFDDYEAFADELALVPELLAEVAKEADPFAAEFAERHRDTDYYFLSGAGNLWGFTYLYSMCILEEMQWLRTTRVHAAEFFHGSLELIERDTALLLFAGEDATRPLIDRVIRFAKQYSDDVTVIDTRDYALPGVSDRFRPLLAPLVADVVADRISNHLAEVRDHSLDLRRYYRKVEY